jgi:hypothetical protein
MVIYICREPPASRHKVDLLPNSQMLVFGEGFVPPTLRLTVDIFVGEHMDFFIGAEIDDIH